MRLFPLAAIVVAATLVVGGCGGGETAEEQVRATAEEFFEATDFNRGEEACRFFVDSFRKRLGDICPQVVLSEEVSPPSAKVTSVKVSGDKALVVAQGANGTRTQMTFVRQGDSWRISGEDL